MPGRRAGSPIAVQYMCDYNAESPKHDSKRFNSIVKTIHFAHFVLYLIYASVFILLLWPTTVSLEEVELGVEQVLHICGDVHGQLLDLLNIFFLKVRGSFKEILAQIDRWTTVAFFTTVQYVLEDKGKIAKLKMFYESFA